MTTCEAQPLGPSEMEIDVVEPLRVAEPREIELAWRQLAGNTGMAEKVEFITTSVRIKPNLAYSLRHDDRQVLRDIVTELQSAMSGLPGVYEISDNLNPGARQIEVELIPEGEAAGLTPASLGAQLRARLHGIEAQRVQRGREEISVVVSYPLDGRGSLDELGGLRLYRPGKGEVPLSSVARLIEKRELAEITRLDGRQVVYVHAKVDTATITPNCARRLLENGIIGNLEERYPDLVIERDGRALDELETLRTLITLVPLSLLAIYVVMATFLHSYWKPLIAAAGIPAAFVGAVLAHWILGWNLTVMSIFGIVAVAGVVVNDGLILLDRYGAIRRETPSLPAIAVAASATRQRFRPVLLTSLTTVLGLSPLIYERSDALLFMVPFATSMMGGLITAGLFVLFVMPAMIMIAEGNRE